MGVLRMRLMMLMGFMLLGAAGALAQSTNTVGGGSARQGQDETDVKVVAAQLQAQLDALQRETVRRLACQFDNKVSDAIGCVAVTPVNVGVTYPVGLTDCYYNLGACYNNQETLDFLCNSHSAGATATGHTTGGSAWFLLGVFPTGGMLTVWTYAYYLGCTGSTCTTPVNSVTCTGGSGTGTGIGNGSGG